MDCFSPRAGRRPRGLLCFMVFHIALADNAGTLHSRQMVLTVWLVSTHFFGDIYTYFHFVQNYRLLYNLARDDVDGVSPLL